MDIGWENGEKCVETFLQKIDCEEEQRTGVSLKEANQPMGHTLQKGNYKPYMGNSGNDAGERMKIQEC